MFLFSLNVVSMEAARIPDGEVRTLIDQPGDTVQAQVL